jgi:hypothetical protein
MPDDSLKCWGRLDYGERIYLATEVTDNSGDSDGDVFRLNDLSSLATIGGFSVQPALLATFSGIATQYFFSATDGQVSIRKVDTLQAINDKNGLYLEEAAASVSNCVRSDGGSVVCADGNGGAILKVADMQQITARETRTCALRKGQVVSEWTSSDPMPRRVEGIEAFGGAIQVATS